MKDYKELWCTKCEYLTIWDDRWGSMQCVICGNKLSTGIIHRIKISVENARNTLRLRSKLSTSLTGVLPYKAKRGAAKRVSSSGLLLGFGGAICLAAALANISGTNSQPKVKVIYQTIFEPKLYVYESLSFKNFVCADRLAQKESNWNPRSKNGSHYGIFQGKSEWLKTATPLQQIEWSFKYITNRYGTTKAGEPDYCAAWQHFKAKGWH